MKHFSYFIEKNLLHSFFLFSIILSFSFCKKGEKELVETRKIENIRAFAKVYGYVKYFHPSDEASEIDWDYFAIYGTKKILECKSNDDLIKTLE
jgi:hypothetical protein